MTKRTSVFIAGRHLASARAAHGYDQREFVDLYLSAYNRLSEQEQRTVRKLDVPTLSHFENSDVGDRYSKVKIKTAELLAQLLGVQPQSLYQASVPLDPLSQADPVLVAPTLSPEKINDALLPLPPNSARFIGGQAELDAIDLPYISASFRPAFAQAGGQLTSFPSINLRRTYLRGIPLFMFTNRAIFEVDGDSMEPYINSGDEVTACRVEESKWETVTNCIVVVAYGDCVTIKKVVENDLSTSSTLTLLPYRPELAPVVVRRSEIRAIYFVERITPRSFQAII